MRLLAALLLLLTAVTCGPATQRAAAPAPPTAPPSLAATRDPGRDSLPLVAEVSANGSLHSFEGGDDHVTFGVNNQGRDIQELVIDAGSWLHEHTIAMGTSKVCEVEVNPDLITCGPVYSGQRLNVVVRALPLGPGQFHYEVRFFSREAGRLLPILDASGRQPVIGLDEIVDPQTQQVPGYIPTATPPA